MIATRLLHPAVLAALAIAAMATALGYQYLGGYQPCELCIWQRWALLPAIPLALAAWAMAPGSFGRLAFLVLTALTFLACAGVAGYHVGVEQHWWAGTDDCVGADLTAGGGIDALRSQLLATPVVRCDEVTWSVLGISMAGYNMAFSLVAAGLALITAGRTGRTASPRTGDQDGRIPHRPPASRSKRARLHRMIRVDHAGEYGAKRIYEGQLAVLGDGPKGDLLRHMADQEAEHLAAFERRMRDGGVRPSVLQPLWHVAGFALGAATALMGERAAMACTVAVEEVIDGHYAAQEAELGDDEPELKAEIERFREEELEHRDIGLANEAEQTPGYRVLTTVIKAGSRAAIWTAERF